MYHLSWVLLYFALESFYDLIRGTEPWVAHMQVSTVNANFKMAIEMENKKPKYKIEMRIG